MARDNDVAQLASSGLSYITAVLGPELLPRAAWHPFGRPYSKDGTLSCRVGPTDRFERSFP
jgi:hypothetical protein